METDSKIPGVLDLTHFQPELRRLMRSPFDVIEEIQFTRRDRFSREAIKNRASLNLEEELRKLIAEEEREVRYLQQDGLLSHEIVERRNQSPTSRRIKELLREFDIAKMNTSGDWIINRKSEIPESMGVVPFNELMDLLANFNWIYERDKAERVIALDLGCGNGEFCEQLRSETKGHEAQSWEIYGYADCIYFNLKDFLKNLLKEENQDDDVLEEFIGVISILIIRAIHETQAYSGVKTLEQEILQELPKDIGLIREILKDLQSYIDIDGKSSVRVDLEFLSDAEREISIECQRLIDWYLQNPKEFIEIYFREEAQGLSPKERKRLGEIKVEIREVRKSFSRVTQNMTRSMKKLSPERRKSHEEKLQQEWHDKARRTTMVENRNKLVALNKEMQKLVAKEPDLSSFISLYHYNVIPGDFDELDVAVPEDSVNFMWAFRSTSHLGDGAYWQIIKKAASRLAPGGVFLDDGKRESWTRYERISQLENLQEELGAEYKIRIITSGGEANSILIERAIQRDDEKVFFSEKFGEEMLADGHEIIDVHEWVTALPTIYVRNRIIEVVREALVDATYEGLRGRLYFKGVHPIIDTAIHLAQRELEMSVNNLSLITSGLQKSVLNTLSKEGTPEVQQLLRERQRPRKTKESISTLSRTQKIKIPTMPKINQVRAFKVTDLPRNRDVPRDEALQMRKFELGRNLMLLKDASGRPPITVCEFDDCFTNTLMIDLLKALLKEVCFTYGIEFEDLVHQFNIQLDSNRYSKHGSLGFINIIGGSTGDVYDQNGERFTNHFVRPLLDKIAGGAQARFLGICFGSQSILQAFGRQQELGFYTAPGALQYGAFPVSFTNSFNGSGKSILKELAGASYTVSMTRGSYSMVDGYEKLGEDLISPLAYEYNKVDGRMEVDKSLPPVAFSLYGGKVVTSQFHPEISLKSPESNVDMHNWLDRNHQYLRQVYQDSGTQLPQHFNLKTLSDSGIVNWVQNDIGPLFVLNALYRQVQTLVEDLHLG